MTNKTTQQQRADRLHDAMKEKAKLYKDRKLDALKKKTAQEKEPAEQLEAAKQIIIRLLEEVEENAPDYYALDVVLHADMWLRWYDKEGTPEELEELRAEIKKDY